MLDAKSLLTRLLKTLADELFIARWLPASVMQLLVDIKVLLLWFLEEPSSSTHQASPLHVRCDSCRCREDCVDERLFFASDGHYQYARVAAHIHPPAPSPCGRQGAVAGTRP